MNAAYASPLAGFVGCKTGADSPATADRSGETPSAGREGLQGVLRSRGLKEKEGSDQTGGGRRAGYPGRRIAWRGWQGVGRILRRNDGRTLHERIRTGSARRSNRRLNVRQRAVGGSDIWNRDAKRCPRAGRHGDRSGGK